MIVVSGVIEVAATGRDRAAAAAAELARATRTEPGCISYAFYADLEQSTRFRVFEEWQDGDALAAHFRTPHMKAFRAALEGVEILSRQVKRYDVSAIADL